VAVIEEAWGPVMRLLGYTTCQESSEEALIKPSLGH
jgi:hypothetical protein